MDVVPGRAFDLLITHHPSGEYRRHRRHEECARAVAALWSRGQLRARQLWTFAYDNERPALLCRARSNADRLVSLSPVLLRKKRSIIQQIYGFSDETWEARTLPEIEAFLCFEDPGALKRRSYLFDSDEGAAAV
jgi:hypothetical protein